MKLESLGFGAQFVSGLTDGELPGRVICVQRDACLVWSEVGVVSCVLRGRLRHEASVSDLPVVGDWVALQLDAGQQLGVVERVLPRKSLLARKRPNGSSELQLMAANLDFVFVVMALNQDFSPRRLERALALIWESGAQPVVVLTKLDTCPDPEPFLEQARAVALGVPVHAVSVLAGQGVEALELYLRPAQTVALIGSSGVGKSTLLNHCLGEERAATAEAREVDAKGRHTTTARELFVLPTGALLIDTPGMRELGLVEAEAGLPAAFADIDALAARCRFADCEHVAEPGCAVQAALDSGDLEPDRMAAFGKLERELAYEQRRHDDRAKQEHQRAVRRVHREHNRALRAHPKR
ncbi:MAG TPA: ribosome small subunit-dependent GTPase A [Polyangiales bacterium]|nr:ribosome small subunit-dependent GTPase A [Polyangiales bacterium]